MQLQPRQLHLRQVGVAPRPPVFTWVNWTQVTPPPPIWPMQVSTLKRLQHVEAVLHPQALPRPPIQVPHLQVHLPTMWCSTVVAIQIQAYHSPHLTSYQVNNISQQCLGITWTKDKCLSWQSWVQQEEPCKKSRESTSSVQSPNKRPQATSKEFVSEATLQCCWMSVLPWFHRKVAREDKTSLYFDNPSESSWTREWLWSLGKKSPTYIFRDAWQQLIMGSLLLLSNSSHYANAWDPPPLAHTIWIYNGPTFYRYCLIYGDMQAVIFISFL